MARGYSDIKIGQKRAILAAINEMLEYNNVNIVAIEELFETHPLIEQSFYRDKSDTRDILDAVKVYVKALIPLENVAETPSSR